MGVFAAVAAGVVLLTSLRSNYLNTLGDQLNGFNTSHFGATGGLLWAAFVRERERVQAVVYMCIFLQDLHVLCMLIICRVLVSVQCTRISV